MNQNIESLLKLQEFDLALDDLFQKTSKAGPERERLKTEIKDLQAKFEASKKGLIGVQVEKKNLELDIESKEQAVRKHSGELNSVKSNDAYKGLLSQIEEAKKAKSALEDRVLELMEKIDGFQREVKEGEKRLAGEKAAVEAKIAQLDASEKTLQAEHDGKKAERDQYYQALAADLRQGYDNARRDRRGVAAVVPVRNNICGGCRMTLPASIVNQVMKASSELCVCETCSRILYLPPSAEKAEAAAAS